MTSFIELPRVTHDGRPQASIYVNTDDIVAFQAEYDGQTKVTVRELGSEGVGIVTTYVPLAAFRITLEAVDWGDDSKKFWAAPIIEKLQAQWQRERGA